MKRKHLFCRFEQMQVHSKIKINTAFSILSQLSSMCLFLLKFLEGQSGQKEHFLILINDFLILINDFFILINDLLF